MVRGLRTGVLRCVVWFSASFSHKLANFPLLNKEAELLPVAPEKYGVWCKNKLNLWFCAK
jgi:hypothetical protein